MKGIDMWSCFKLTKNKAIEFELHFIPREWFVFKLESRSKTDHAGFIFDFTLLRLFTFIIHFYDGRHWDYEKDCWEIYDINKNMDNDKSVLGSDKNKKLYVLHIKSKNMPKSNLKISKAFYKAFKKYTGSDFLDMTNESMILVKRSSILKITMSLFDYETDVVLKMANTFFKDKKNVLIFMYQLSEDVQVITADNKIIYDVRNFMLSIPEDSHEISQEID